jgi:hypothetical protein
MKYAVSFRARCCRYSMLTVSSKLPPSSVKSRAPIATCMTSMRSSPSPRPCKRSAPSSPPASSSDLGGNPNQQCACLISLIIGVVNDE